MKHLKLKIIIKSIIIFLLIILFTLPPFSYLTPSKNLKNPSSPKPAEAAFEYTASSQTLTNAGTVAGNYLDTRDADQGYFRIMTTDSGLDVTFTIDNVKLWNANQLTVMYDGFVSSTALTYQIEIYDFFAKTWRNIIHHEATYKNIVDSGNGLTLQLAVTEALSGGLFPIYDGYFTDGSNNPISTPLSNFVNKDKQVKIRFYSSVATADLELSIDFLIVQASNTPISRASSMTIAANSGTISSGEYNDTITDDNTENLQITAGSSGIDVSFNFNNMALPYVDANTYLVEFSGFRTTITNYTIALRDFQNSEWDTLSGTALTNTTDSTYYFALVPSTLAQNMTDYIQNDQMQVRVYSASTSGSVTIDLVRITIGSTATNAGIYTGSISRGSTSTGDVTNTRDLDTSNATPSNSAWVIDTSNSDARSTTQFVGDCNSNTNHCASANVTVPITVPDNSVIQGVIVAYRFITSSSALDLVWTIRDYDGSYTDVNAAASNQSDTAINIMHIIEASNPMPPRVGEGQLSTVPLFTPLWYVDRNNNAANLRFRTGASDTTARTVTWDFAFVTIKSILPHNPEHYRFTPTGGVVTYGTETDSNYRFAIGDDATNWQINADGSNGVDTYLSFTGVTIPAGANKFIITSNTGWSVGSNPFEIFVWDFTGGGQWRELTPHGTNYTGDATVTNYDYAQIEVYDGYFTDGNNNYVSTPLSNFVSGGEVRIRINSDSTSANLYWDFAQIQFVIGVGFAAANMTITSGSVNSGEYNDTTTDDNTSNLVISPSSNLIDFYFSFKNAPIPPEGFNAILLNLSAYKSTSGTYDVSIRNFTTNEWEPVVSTAAQTADASHSFIKNNIGDWHNYIQDGEIRIQMYSSASATNLNIDLIEIILGTSPNENSPSSSNVGQVIYGGVSSLSNLNTLQSTDTTNSDNFLLISHANSTTGIQAFDDTAVAETEVTLPFFVRPGTSPTDIIWMYRGLTGSTSATLGPSVAVTGGHFRYLSPSFQFTTTTLTALPNAADTITLASATLVTRSGIFNEVVSDIAKDVTNKITFRIYTATASPNAQSVAILDTLFFSYRWIPTETDPSPDNQLKHGKWWFGGQQQKDTF